MSEVERPGNGHSGPPSSAPPQPAKEDSSCPLVLIAEDDAKTLRLVGEVIQRGGYRAALAPNGVGAVKLLKRARPDLIILDLKMPRMDGFQLLELLKKYETSSSIPVVVLTGSNEMKDINRALELGVSDYLIKPISPRKLLTKIRQLLR